MSSSPVASTTPSCSTTTRTAELITYRFEDQLVYVKPEPNYKDALDIVVKEFPILSEVDRERLSLSTIATMNGTRRTVRISESAWTPTSARLARGEVIDVTLKPPLDDLRSRSAESLLSPPPQYLEVPDVKMGMGMGYHSAPASRASSPAPSARSRKSFLERVFCFKS